MSLNGASSTLENAYAKIIASMLNTAQHHNDVSDALTMQVIGPLMVLDKKNQDHRKKVCTCRSEKTSATHVDVAAWSLLPEVAFRPRQGLQRSCEGSSIVASVFVIC